MLVVPIALFVLGSIIASFVGVLVARLNTGQEFFISRSRCDACNAPLEFYSLVPIISFFANGGKSHCCKTRISPYAPITELLLGCLFVLAYLDLGLTIALPFILIALSSLLALVLYDLNHQILPPPILAIFIILSAVARFLIGPVFTEFLHSLIIAAIISAFIAVVHFLSRGRAMGFADAPLVFGLSLLVGSAALSGFVFSFWIGAVIGILILARRPSGSRIGVEVPFAPFLAAGFLLAYFTKWNLFATIAGLPSTQILATSIYVLGSH